jgi:hypothetical protein
MTKETEEKKNILNSTAEVRGVATDRSWTRVASREFPTSLTFFAFYSSFAAIELSNKESI